jgi:hypothetical protein
VSLETDSSEPQLGLIGVPLQLEFIDFRTGSPNFQFGRGDSVQTIIRIRFVLAMCVVHIMALAHMNKFLEFVAV